MYHPWLARAEFLVLVIILAALFGAVRAFEFGQTPELVSVPPGRENLPPLPESPTSVARITPGGEIVITEEINMSRWLTYESTAYHYSFRYPSDDWFIEEFGDYAVLVPPGDIGRIEINAVAVGRESPLDGARRGDTLEGILTENDAFAGRSADQYRCVSCKKNRFARHIRMTDLRGTNWGSTNEIWYDFSLEAGEKHIDALTAVALFDRVLSTFILDDAFNEEVWPRYTNTDAGFSIKHPPAWGFREALIGEGTDFIVALGPDIPSIGRGLRVYMRGNADPVVGARRVCGDFAYDMVRDPGAGAETDVMIQSFLCQ